MILHGIKYGQECCYKKITTDWVLWWGLMQSGVIVEIIEKTHAEVGIPLPLTPRQFANNQYFEFINKPPAILLIIYIYILCGVCPETSLIMLNRNKQECKKSWRLTCGGKDTELHPELLSETCCHRQYTCFWEFNSAVLYRILSFTVFTSWHRNQNWT